MANKIDPLQTLTSTYGAVAALNSNFTNVAAAMAKTLSRDGSGPNQMLADFDMNHFNILNIGNASDIKGEKGDIGAPGVNGATASNLTIGLFSTANGQSLAGSPEAVFTSGYSATGRGAAWYVKDAVVDAAFVAAHPRWSFRSSQGVGYRLSPEQKVLFEMFGAIGDATAASSGTDNYNAWLAAKDFIHYFRTYPAGNSYYKPSVPLNFSPTGYEFSNYLDLTDAAYELFGSGSPGSGGGGGTTFFFTGTCGLVLQSWDTAGVSSINQPNNAGTPHGASDSHVRDIFLYSRGGTIGAEQHGVLIKCGGVHFERVTAQYFGGDGFHIYGNVTGAGNANTSRFDFCGGHFNGGSGLWVAGGDANAILFLSFQANFNRKYGIAEASFLGNTHIGYHGQSNGMPGSYGAGPNWAPANSVPGSRCTYGGTRWRVKPGKDTLAETTTPGTDATVWENIPSDTLAFIEAWTSGHKYCAGGRLYVGSSTWANNNNNTSGFLGYFEGDQPFGIVDSSGAFGLGGVGYPGLGLSGALGGIAAGKIGARAFKTGGATNVIAMLGSGSAAEADQGQWLTLGTNDTPNWRGIVTTGDVVYFDWLASGASIPLKMNPGTTGPGVELPRGLSIGSLVNAANDTAAATAGVAIGTVYRNGSQLMIRVT